MYEYRVKLLVLSQFLGIEVNGREQMVVNFNKASTKCVFYSVGFEISTEVELITVLYTYVQCSKTALQPLKSNLYLVCGIL